MGKQWKQWETLLFLIFILVGSNITADGDCSHKIKRHLLIGKKSYDQPRQHIKKQRQYFASKGLSSQTYGFSSSLYGCELYFKQSWVLKNWCFWTLVWRRLLRVPWTARRSNQSILKEISLGCSLEGLKLKLIFQYFGPLMWRTDSLKKTLMLGKGEGRRRRGW